MSRLSKAIRNKRFDVKEGIVLNLLFETKDHRFHSIVKNASVGGMAVVIDTTTHPDGLALKDGDFITASKLFWNDKEATLGRLLVSRVFSDEKQLMVGLRCLDSNVPLIESLSHCFAELATGEESPFGYELGSPKFNLASFSEEEFKHPDLFEKCRQYDFLHKELRKKPLYQYYSIKYASDQGRATYKLANRPKKKDYVSFASYDYMGFSRHPKVIEASVAAVKKYGVSSEGTMILSGKTDLHNELEIKLASYFGKEDAVLYSSGFAANTGIISALARQNDLIVSDIYAHASLHDGMQSTSAKVKYFRHNDMDHLEKILSAERANYNGCLLVTEGIYSMEGTVPDLERFVELAKKYNARTFIDECHSLGHLGRSGRGAADAADVLEEIDLFMGSFSKGLGVGCCGFLAADKVVIDWLRFFSRTNVFSAALPPAMVAASLAVLELMESDTTQRLRLERNIDRFNDGLRHMGITTPAQRKSPIIPIVIGDQERMSKMNETLLDLGVYVNCILFPAVPVDACRFRFSITANHNDSDIDLALQAIRIAVEKVSIEQLANSTKGQLEQYLHPRIIQKA